jgi:hypothetical protein
MKICKVSNAYQRPQTKKCALANILKKYHNILMHCAGPGVETANLGLLELRTSGIEYLNAPTT